MVKNKISLRQLEKVTGVNYGTLKTWLAADRIPYENLKPEQTLCPHLPRKTNRKRRYFNEKSVEQVLKIKNGEL